MATSFPIPGVFPQENEFQESLAGSPAIRTQFDNGYILSRTMQTSVKKVWQFTYRGITNTEKEAMADFQEDVLLEGDRAFGMTNPRDDSEMFVRFLDILRFSLHAADNTKWDVTVSFIEA